MSFSAGTTTKDTSSTATQTLDPQLDSAVYGNLANAQALASTPFQPYTGQQVASFTPTQLQAQGALAGISNSQVGAQPLQSAIGLVQNTANYSPGQVTPSMVSPTSVSADSISAPMLSGVDLSAYMNPYTSSVINSSLQDLYRQQQIQDQNDASKATMAGAFGGSRSAVLQNLDDDSYARAAASTAAGLNQSNFSQAQTAAQGDLGRQLTAGQSNQSAALQAALANQSNSLQAALANQNAGLQAAQFNQNLSLQAAGMNANLNLNTANALAGYGNQQLSQAQQWAGDLSTAGNAQQQNQQAQLDAAYQQWLLAQQYPIQMQQLVNSAVAALPRAGTTSTTGNESDDTTNFGFGGSAKLNGNGDPTSFAFGG
jgi:hypothetical protein